MFLSLNHTVFGKVESWSRLWSRGNHRDTMSECVGPDAKRDLRKARLAAAPGESHCVRCCPSLSSFPQGTSFTSSHLVLFLFSIVLLLGWFCSACLLACLFVCLIIL